MPETAEKSLPQIVTELWELIKRYARQQIVDPLRGVGRFLGYGLAAAILGSIGVVLLLVALLRALQTQTDTTFTGNLSWVPYLIVLAIGAVLTLVALSRISTSKEAKVHDGQRSRDRREDQSR